MTSEDPEFWPTRKDGQPLTPFEVSVYARTGLSPRQAQSWARAGIEPYQAEAFRNAGVLSVTKAASWVKRGVSGVQYARWIGQGLDPEEQPEPEDHQAVEKRAETREWLQPDLEERLLITVGQIAELAQPTDQRRHRATSTARVRSGIDPANVTHWRKNKTGFPAPVVGGRSPQFNAAEVLDWMRERGNLRPGQPEADWYWRQTIRSLPPGSSVDHAGQMRSYIAALVLLSASARGEIPGVGATGELPRDVAQAQKLASSLSKQHPELGEVLRPGFVNVTARSDTYLRVRDALEYCAAQDHPLDGWQLLDEALKVLFDLARSAPVTEPFLVDLMTGLLPDRVESVLDAACGEGELLARLAPRAEELCGIDEDPSAVCVARAKFLLLPRHSNVAFMVGDALAPGTAPDREFDAVVLDPAFGKGRRPAAWVKLALDHLRRDGRAIAVVPTTALRAHGPLKDLFQRGRIGAVILLPPSTRFGEHRRLAVCVFAGHDQAHERVAVVDLTMEKIDSTAFTPGIPKTPSFGSLLYARRVATSLKAWLAEPLEAQMAGLRLLGPMATAMSSERAATDGIAFFVYRPEQAPVIEEARLLRDHLAQHADLIGAADLASAINRFLNEANPGDSS